MTAKLYPTIALLHTEGVTTSERWAREIESACAEPSLARSNQFITSLHCQLSEALADRMGREGGPNFHTWAVWGSRKAGVTIRQEDLDKGRDVFFAGLRAGPTEKHGQQRLATAFRSYLAAFDTTDVEAKRAAMIEGNSEIVYHEHVRLEPYIRGAMPLIIRHCATQRLMTFDIGEQVLTVGEDLPGVPRPTAARNWAKIEERMRYIFALFRKFHNSPEVFSRPYSEIEMAQMEQPGNFPG